MNAKYFILALSLATAPLFGQEKLTLEQCRELALAHNKEIAAAARQTAGARYTMKSYRGNFFPNISLSGTGMYSTADGNFSATGGNLPTYSLDALGEYLADGGFAYFPGLALDYKIGAVYTGGISLEQPLYMGGKIRAAYRMSVLSKEMAQANETLTSTEVILRTEQAYAQVIKAREMRKVALTYHSLLQELLSNVQSAYKHGLRAQNDVLKVQVKVNEGELGVRRAENALRLATMNLCHYIGRPLMAQIEVADDLPEIDANLAVQTLDITARPEYAILDRQEAIARQQVKLNRSELLPQVGLQGSYNYLHGIEVNDETLLDKGAFSVVLNVSIPLYHFGERSNKVRAARAKLEQTRLERENQNEQMLLELSQAANNLDEAQLEDRLALRSLEQAEENMRVSRSQYDVGLETLSDHLEAQTLWQQAYQTRVDASFQLYLAYISYLKAAGRLLD